MTAPVVQVRGLRMTYGERVVLDDVSFAVAPGEIFGILGPNGAGKTTTVECLAGLRSPGGGQMSVFGFDPQSDAEAIRDLVGIQLQEAHLDDRMTVNEALRLFASFYPDPADPEDLLDLLDLREKRGARFGRLSGGEKQRVSIALALVGNPRAAILDELTTGLDPTTRRRTWDLIRRVRDRGVTIILVTHFMDEAERLCDRLVIIDGGRVVAEGSPADLVAGLDDTRTVRVRPADGDHAASVAVLRSTVATDADLSDVVVDGTEIVVEGTRQVMRSVLQSLVAAEIVPLDVRVVTRSLEDVFLATTGRTHSAETTPENPDGAHR